MKKFIALALFGLLIMALSATVHAQQLEFKASGLITSTALYYRNIAAVTGSPNPTQNITSFFSSPWAAPDASVAPSASGAWNRPNAYLVTRMNLVFDAIMSKELSGRVAFEMDAMRWGDNPSTTAAGKVGIWRADATAVEIKHIYLDFGLPYFGIPVPMTARVGLQPLDVRPHILMISDGMGVTGGIKLDPVLIAPMWGKPVEGRDAASDDVDFYGLHANAKLGSLTVGGYGIYFNCNTYPFNQMQTTYGITPANEADFWWFGGYVDGKAGPVNIQSDFIFDYGKVEARGGSTLRDVDYRGWVTRLKVEYPWEKFGFGLVGMYASGADLKKTSTTGLPAATGSANGNGPVTKVHSFVVPPGSEQAGITGDDFFVFGNFVSLEAAPLNMSTSSPVTTNVVHRGSYGGMWFAKLFVGYKVTPWYKVNLEALYLGDTTENGNTLGNAVKSSGALRNDSGIGWEFNLINEINIYKNLKWDIGLGYLIAGDALDQRVGATNFNKSPHNPYIVATKLRYTF
jgi:hypothetical protein